MNRTVLKSNAIGGTIYNIIKITAKRFDIMIALISICFEEGPGGWKNIETRFHKIDALQNMGLNCICLTCCHLGCHGHVEKITYQIHEESKGKKMASSDVLLSLDNDLYGTYLQTTYISIFAAAMVMSREQHIGYMKKVNIRRQQVQISSQAWRIIPTKHVFKLLAFRLLPLSQPYRDSKRSDE